MLVYRRGDPRNEAPVLRALEHSVAPEVGTSMGWRPPTGSCYVSLSREAVRGDTVKLFIARVASVLVVASILVGAGAVSAQAALQDDVFSLTNAQRTSAGVAPLTRDATLDSAAQLWANEMSRTRVFEHSSDDWRVARIPAGWTTHGENIAYGHTSANAVMTDWMASAGHRANILRSTFTRIGVGYVASGNYWVQIFAGYGAGATVSSGLASYWAAQGGAAGPMGNPISGLIVLEGNGGSYQRFQGGTAYASYQYGTKFIANNVFGTQYAQAYGPTGPLGWPASEQMCAPNGVCFQSFAGGTITTSAGAGTHVVWGTIAKYWAGLGGPYNLGAAIGPQDYSQAPTGVGWFQRFQNGTVVLSASGTIVIPRNGIDSTWLATGAGRGFYGWPKSAATCVSTSCTQVFQGGVLSTSAANGTHAILWGLQSVWEQSGGIDGLGVALTDLRGSSASGTGWVQQFSSSAMIVRPNGTSVQIPYGGLWSTWVGAGAEFAYGWPTAAAQCVGAACAQKFQAAQITTGPQGSYAIRGGFVARWETAGGLNTVGAAASSLRYSTANSGGFTQSFAGGVITQVAGSAAVFTPTGPILATWQRYGAEATWLGWPVAAQTCNGDVCSQQFQNGTATSNSGGVQFAPRP